MLSRIVADLYSCLTDSRYFVSVFYKGKRLHVAETWFRNDYSLTFSKFLKTQIYKCVHKCRSMDQLLGQKKTIHF